MIQKITTFVDESFTELFPQKHDIISWLKNHERKTLLLQNLEKEIVSMQRDTYLILMEHDIKKLCKDFARMFADAAIKEKQRTIKSKLHIVTD